MTRPTDWTPLALHADPVPGDPLIVAAFGNRYAEVAVAINYAATKLHAIADHNDGGEVSKYVDKLRDTAKEVADDIQKAHERYSGVAQAMTDYANPLERAQSMADAALTKARGASDQIGQATSLHHHYEQLLNEPGITPDDKTRYTHLQQQNSQSLSKAQGVMYAAQQDLQAAITLRNQAAKTAADAVKDVQSSGGLNDSGWTKFWEHNGGWIDEVVSVLGYIAAGIAVLALCIPILGEIVLAVALIVAAITVIVALCEMTAGTKSVVAGCFEIAIAVIPFGVGRVLGPLGTAAEPGIEDAAAVTMRTSSAAQGIKGITQSKAAAGIAEDLADTKGNFFYDIALGPKSATQLAKMNELAEMGLTKSGASGRIGAMVEDSMSKYEASQLVEPIFKLSGGEDMAINAVDKATEPHEMVNH